MELTGNCLYDLGVVYGKLLRELQSIYDSERKSSDEQEALANSVPMLDSMFTTNNQWPSDLTLHSTQKMGCFYARVVMPRKIAKPGSKP